MAEPHERRDSYAMVNECQRETDKRSGKLLWVVENWARAERQGEKLQGKASETGKRQVRDLDKRELLADWMPDERCNK
jgi:hypothetical protein